MRYAITIDFLYVDAPPRTAYFIGIIADEILSSYIRSDAWWTYDEQEAKTRVAWLNSHLRQNMLGAELVTLP